MYKNLVLGISLILATLLYKHQKTTIYIIGDSTAANKLATAYPETGWGMELQGFFNTEVNVDNRAINGRSTKSFINEKRWQSVVGMLKVGDYVLIQFGHNDQKVDKPEIGTSLSEYKLNLIKFVEETRAKNAQPILLTPIMRRNYKNGVFSDTHLGYPDVVRKLADSLQVPLIDMHRKTEQLIINLGEMQSVQLFNHVDRGNVNYPAGKIDNTHLSPKGAQVIAELVVKGIQEINMPVAKQLLKR